MAVSENLYVFSYVSKDEVSATCCGHKGGSGLKIQGVNQKQPMCYFTGTESLILDVVLFGDNSGGLFHFFECITSVLHFAPSWNPKPCQGKKCVLCTYVCSA